MIYQENSGSDINQFVNKIICGNCADIMKQFPDNSIDLTVTSPPYDDLREYNGYTFEFELIAAELWRVTKPGGVVVWVVADATVNGSETGTSFRQALYFMELGFNLHDTMIYSRDKMPININRYEDKFEFMFVLSNEKPNIFNGIKLPAKRPGSLHGRSSGKRKKNGQLGKRWANNPTPQYVLSGNIWHYNTGRDLPDYEREIASQHPARFPNALVRDHIISWSNPGDIVLDPMCGSGTVPKMCVLLDRRYIGIDISDKYCELSGRRVSQAEVQPKLIPLRMPNEQSSPNGPAPKQLPLLT